MFLVNEFEFNTHTYTSKNRREFETYFSVSDFWVLQRCRTRGAPSPLPRAPKNSQKIIQKRHTWYHLRGTSGWRTCEVTLRLCRGTVPGAPPSPSTRSQECPKILLKNRTWYQTRKHVCAKARLRNPEYLFPRAWYLFYAAAALELFGINSA